MWKGIIGSIFAPEIWKSHFMFLLLFFSWMERGGGGVRRLLEFYVQYMPLYLKSVFFLLSLLYM